MEWSKTYAKTYGGSVNSLIQTPDGGYARAGVTWSYDNADFWLVKVGVGVAKNGK